MSLLQRRMMLGQEDEDVKEWKQIYDSGKIEEEIASFPEVDITGYKELTLLIHCEAVESNPGNRNLGVFISDTNGGVRQFEVLNVFSNSGNKRGALITISNLGGLVFCEGRSSLNMGDTIAGVVTNLSSYVSGVTETLGDFYKVKVTSLNNLNTYRFGIGSRLVILAR